MEQLANNFVARWDQKPLEVEDPSNRDQCMDLAFGWTDSLGIPREAIRHLYAYQVFAQPNAVTNQFFDLVANTPTGVPPAGALVVWKPNGRYTGVAGHIDLALGGSNTNVFRAFDENWNGHQFCEVLPHPYDDVLGWLIPKAVINTPQGGDLMVDQNALNIIYRSVLGREPDPGAQGYLGQPIAAVLAQVANSAEKHQRDADTLKQAQSQQLVIDGLVVQVKGLQDQLAAASTAPATPASPPTPAPVDPSPPSQLPEKSTTPIASFFGSNAGKVILQVLGAVGLYFLDNSGQFGIPPALAAAIGLAIGHTVSNVAATKAAKAN